MKIDKALKASPGPAPRRTTGISPTLGDAEPVTPAVAMRKHNYGHLFEQDIAVAVPVA